MRKYLSIFLLIILFTNSQAFSLELPERRRSQQQTDYGHLLTPAAANIPGIGFTYGILGTFFNIKETEADVYGFYFLGDLVGKGVGLLDAPLFTDHLTLNLGIQNLDKVGVQVYKRGIDSDPDDRTVIELDKFDLLFSQLNFLLFDKRIKFNLGWNQQASHLNAIYDKEGNKLTDVDQSVNTRINYSAGTLIDLTDDNSDPRKGAQLEVYYYDRPRSNDDNANYYVMSYNFLGYIPFGNYSTWVFNVFRSDAVVTDTGDLNPVSVRSRLGYNCEAVSDPFLHSKCLQKELQAVDDTITANRNATADSLGGTQKLRSYATSRFSDAHSLFLGTEFRWNITEEYSKFNIYLASGIRTSMQIAFFAGAGAVQPFVSDLPKKFKESYGVGLRMVMAGGFVFRFDLAAGAEGIQPTLIFQYPYWVF